MMKNKKLVVSVVALVVAAVLMLGLWFVTRQQAVEGAKAISVTVVHKDGTQKDFHYHTDKEYLGEVLLDEVLVEGEVSTYGLMISTADGETADWNVDQSYWAIFIGEEYATTGADGIVLTDGGIYSLVYTIG